MGWCNFSFRPLMCTLFVLWTNSCLKEHQVCSILLSTKLEIGIGLPSLSTRQSIWYPLSNNFVPVRTMPAFMFPLILPNMESAIYTWMKVSSKLVIVNEF
ncbi:hypothetical protein VPH35_005927 [Triticum aestivum]|uniref:Secreted protein n=1 Tax=Triticum turgidum subsp. durum TaxID=4567 RepID=A0A9R0V2R5_TRITD|nr:unnamed protein product [Triticum turgidum subsp. durum]